MWGVWGSVGEGVAKCVGCGGGKGKGVWGGGKVLGEVWESVLGCGESNERWEIQGGCGKVLGKVWESVLGCRKSKEETVEYGEVLEKGVGKCVGV